MLIIEIIAELEKDRSTIVKELKSYSKEQSKINIPEEIKTGERLVEELTNSETLLAVSYTHLVGGFPDAEAVGGKLGFHFLQQKIMGKREP